MKKVLGIAAFFHDAAAALVVDGQVVAAAQEERFTRQKHTAVFPVQAIRYCLEEGGLAIDELDAVVFYEKPLLKFERLLQTYYAYAPRGWRSFIKAIPVWLEQKLFFKKQIYDGLKQVGEYDKKQLRLLFSAHHLSHAASAFFPSRFSDAAILTIDGVGEWSTAAIYQGKGTKITPLREMAFPHSIGLLYSAFTYYLGFKVNSGEYKLMGLAPFGQPDAAETQGFREKIESELIDCKADGSVWLNPAYFDYATGLRMAKDKRWEQLFGFPRRKPEGPLKQHHANLALAIQTITEEVVLRMATEAKRITKADALCLAGGVALNCVANGKLLRSNLFKDIYIQPAAGDAGGALGAALAIHYHFFAEKRLLPQGSDAMAGALLGPSFSDKEIRRMNRRMKAVSHHYEEEPALLQWVAGRIAAGQIVGWFQGRMEFGPRALGNRSILADARRTEMQQKLNLSIKYRESFRPFAPAVLAENCADYFDLDTDSSYMLFVAPVKADHRLPVPDQEDQYSLIERLKIPRSTITAVTHLDYSARVQTVSKSTNPRFYHLLQAFKAQTGSAVLINTSFNVRGEPIVCTPEDAYRCFMATEMDLLVINDFVYIKTEQPDGQNRAKWQRTFKAD